MPSSLLDDPDFAPAGAARDKAISPLIQAELADGERLVWVGQPRPRQAGWVHPNYRILFVVPGIFSGAIGLAAIIGGLAERSSVQDGGPVLVGLVMGVVGLCLIWIGLRDLLGSVSPHEDGRPSLDPVRNWFDQQYDRRIQGTWYALTDRRVILWEPTGFGYLKVRSLRPKDFTGISRTQRADGSGVLLLEIMAVQPTGVSGPVPVGRLCGIDDVRAVEALIRATLFAT